MGRHVAVIRPQNPQTVAHQTEMLGLLIGHFHPAVEEGMRHGFARKTRYDVECQVDGIELDMRERMEEGDAAGQGMQRAFLDGLRRDEFRLLRPPGLSGSGGSSGERSERRRSCHRTAAAWASAVFSSRSALRIARVAAPRRVWNAVSGCVVSGMSEGLCRLQDGLGVAGYFDLAPDLGNLAGLVDQEGRTLHAM